MAIAACTGASRCTAPGGRLPRTRPGPGAGSHGTFVQAVSHVAVYFNPEWGEVGRGLLTMCAVAAKSEGLYGRMKAAAAIMRGEALRLS